MRTEIELSEILDTLQKGSTIPVEMCEKILGISRDHKHYNFRLLKLTHTLINHSLAVGLNNGHGFSMSIEGQGIKVHSDSEAANYHHAQEMIGLKKHKRHNYVARKTVNTNNLSDKQRERFLRERELSDRICKSIRSIIRGNREED